MNRKKLLSLALAGILGISALSSPAVTVEASPSSVSGYDELISELSEEEDEVMKELNILQEDIKDNEKETEKLVGEIAETKSDLEKLQIEIDELKEVIKKREAHLSEQARGIQVAGESGNIINFILNAESLNDIVGRIDVVSIMISSNQTTIAKQEEDKALVEEKEAETVEKQEKQAKIAKKLEDHQTTLEEQKAEQETVLARIASEKDVAESDRAELVAQALAAAEEARRQSLAKTRTTSAQSSLNSNSNSSSSSNSVSTSSSTASSSPSTVSKSSGGWLRPTSGGSAVYLSSRYGHRWGRMHNGIDLARQGGSGAKPGIVAAKSGTVTKASFHSSYGNYVVINHGGGISSLYAHLQNLSVSSGQSVSAGQHLGTMGATGRVTGVHLHFEIQQNGRPVNPESFMSF